MRVVCVAPGDLDGDGDEDLLAGTIGTGLLAWLGDGSGGLEPFPLVGADGVQVRVLALGDLDRDGDLDVVRGTGSGTPDDVMENLGRDADGVWLGLGAPRILEIDGVAIAKHTGDLALGDFDGNGVLDLFIGYGPGTQNRLWIGDGFGGFTATADEYGELDCRAVAVGDVNQDGLLDVVTGNVVGERVLLGDGKGRFTVFADLSVSDTHALELRDLDGDGDLEILAGNDLEQGVAIWRNDGTGRFGEHPWIRLRNRSIHTLMPLDVDGDGDCDLATGEALGGETALWLNR